MRWLIYLLNALGRRVNLVAKGAENDYYEWADCRLDELALQARLDKTTGENHDH